MAREERRRTTPQRRGPTRWLQNPWRGAPTKHFFGRLNRWLRQKNWHACGGVSGNPAQNERKRIFDPCFPTRPEPPRDFFSRGAARSKTHFLAPGRLVCGDMRENEDPARFRGGFSKNAHVPHARFSKNRPENGSDLHFRACLRKRDAGCPAEDTFPCTWSTRPRGHARK